MKLHLGQITFFSREGAVVFCGVAIGSAESGAISIVIVTADACCFGIGNQFASINSRLRGATSNIAVEHAVDHCSAEVGVFAVCDRCSAGSIIISDNAGRIGGSTDIGVAITIDDARIIFKQSHDASGASAGSSDIGMSAFGERGIVRQDAAVVNTAVALSCSGYGTYITV